MLGTSEVAMDCVSCGARKNDSPYSPLRKCGNDNCQQYTCFDCGVLSREVERQVFCSGLCRATVEPSFGWSVPIIHRSVTP